jgi:hypothetical protein
MTDAKQEAWIKKWDVLPYEQKLLTERDWSLSDWLYWLKPANRQWFWWDAKIVDPQKLILTVVVLDWPFPWDALSWLLTAAGANNVTAES